jgi:uncharacterized protein YicC (UPF0701 family)
MTTEEQTFRKAMANADAIDRSKIVKEVAALYVRKSDLLKELARIEILIGRREEKLAS